MKKLISIICLTFLFVCGYGQTRLSYKWEDATRNLYYRSAYTTTYTYSYNCNTYTGTCCPYAIDSNADTCMIVYPSYGTSFVAGLCMPYKKLTNWTSNGLTFAADYAKPQGNLNIPFYTFATGNCSNYKTVTRICDQAFSSCTDLTKITIPSTVKRIDEMFIFGCTNLDTIVFNNTFSQDTIYPPLMNSETWLIDHQIAIVVPCNAYDTFYNYIHNLGAVNINLINIIPDNICDCGAYVIDTVQVYDTIQVNVTVYDTVTIHDTTITTIIDTLPVYDTTFVNQTVFVYDTTNVYDTILINEYHLIHLYDTIVIHDTVVHNIWNMYYDTTIVTVIDTSVLELYDTLVITVYDTNTIDWYDTNVIYIYETCFDTVVTTIFDTIVNYIYDTIYTTIYDTVVVFVESPLAFDELKLYPVPTRDYVTVEYTGTLNYALFNDRGKFLETGNIQYTDRLDMTRYATGTYIFKAVLDDGRIVAKKIQKVTM